MLSWLNRGYSSLKKISSVTKTEWLCGSVGCYMGWVVYLECYVNNNPDLEPAEYDEEYFNYKGQHRHVREIASDLLGLDEHDAIMIYRGDNTIEDLEVMVKDMANGEPPKWRGGDDE